MDCYRHVVGVELLPLLVLGLELQMDCYPDAEALVQRHLLERQVLVLPVRVVESVQLVDAEQQMLALLIPPQYRVDCECSHRVERLQHQSLLELALLF
jgi:hypothetical protein